MEKRDVVVEIDIPFAAARRDYLAEDLIYGWDTKRMEAYAHALCDEIGANADSFKDCRVAALRFDGGTASNAGAHLASIMRSLRNSFTVCDDVPISMRAAISNISGATMPFFKRAGVSRFDFEMMSLDSTCFTKLNKVDNLKDLPIICDYFLHAYANNSLGLVLAFGYTFGTEKDATASFRRSIVSVTRSHASHLILERAFAEDSTLDGVAANQLRQARELLEEAGFIEYLPLHFSRPGFEDAFLLSNSQGSDRIAFGLGAETRIEGVISKNTLDLATYLQHSTDFERITTSVAPVCR